MLALSNFPSNVSVLGFYYNTELDCRTWYMLYERTPSVQHVRAESKANSDDVRTLGMRTQ